jgi:hypothetical protein
MNTDPNDSIDDDENSEPLMSKKSKDEKGSYKPVDHK